MVKAAKALILATGPNGLGALRSLQKAGISCDVIVDSHDDVSWYSRIPVNKQRFNHDNDSELMSLLRSWPGKNQVLIPTSDWYVNFIERHQQVLSQKFKYALPSEYKNGDFIDKREEVLKVQAFVNLPVSMTHLPDTAETLVEQCQLPIIIKPRSHQHNVFARKNLVVNSLGELQDFYQQYASQLDMFIGQHVIAGDDDSQWVCNCVFDRQHQLVSYFTFQRLQLSPPHYGVTCHARSDYNEDIIEQVYKLGIGCRLVGPVMVEFKFDASDGKYKYIELNPRLGMCNYFDSQCGVNNVFASYQVALNLPVPSYQQQNGCYFLSFYEDLYSRYRDGQSFADICKAYWRTLGSRYFFIYFSWRDPWPALVVGYVQLKRSFLALTRKFSRGDNVRL
ncbi:hypothetical protein [Thalassotalea sp. Y01]|uniref:carboxylate--amine ligase n=1 Tax=Thalassotalea sp. Y01 TaxID=2729613 RepID=UPI00145F37EB|nr:hypothetical protein [Thalassotalea sp. Y01]NMP16191.1 hypothetical protein [Thalassotalea sp. Y01]